MADALAILALMFKVNKGQKVTLIHISIYESFTYCYNVKMEAGGLPWYHDIKRYLKDRACPDNASKANKRTLRKLAVNFVLDGEIFYKKIYNQVLPRCVDAFET